MPNFIFNFQYGGHLEFCHKSHIADSEMMRLYINFDKGISYGGQNIGFSYIPMFPEFHIYQHINFRGDIFNGGRVTVIFNFQYGDRRPSWIVNFNT